MDRVILIGRWLPDRIGDLERTVRTLPARGIPVTVFGPTVEYDGDFPALLAQSMELSQASAVEQFRRKERKQLDDDMRPRMESAGADFYSVYDIECPKEKCRLTTDDGAPIHFDYGHVTLAAAHLLVSRLTF